MRLFCNEQLMFWFLDKTSGDITTLRTLWPVSTAYVSPYAVIVERALHACIQYQQ